MVSLLAVAFATTRLYGGPPVYQTRLPIFDLTGDVKTVGGQPHLIGSFRFMEKTDRNFSGNMVPEFYVSHSSLHSSPGVPVNPITDISWTVISVPPEDCFLEVGSEVFDPQLGRDDRQATEAIEGFDIPLNAGFQWLTSPDAIAVVMEGDASWHDRHENSPDFLHHEWSFAMTELSEDGSDGFDTNNFVPVTLDLPNADSGFAIGEREDFWMNSYFRGAFKHAGVDSTPWFFGYDSSVSTTPPQPTMWFDAHNWESISTSPSNPTVAYGKRVFSINTSKPYDLIIAGSPDESDFNGARFFQISGVIRRRA